MFWPFVKDPVSAARLRDDKVIEVSSCWNGMVAFPTGPYLYRPKVDAEDADSGHLSKRGWQMIDNGE